MPSPVIHIGYALGYGSLLMTTTQGSFTPIHCLILCLNGFIGPDIGSFISWFFTNTFPLLADKAMDWIHYSIGYILFIAPIIAYLRSRLLKILITIKSRKLLIIDVSNVNNIEESNENSIFINFKNCYLLSIAGCLLHFQIDHIFEEDGQDHLYKWILSTGYFLKPTPPLSFSSILFVGLSCFILIFGFIWIHLLSSIISKKSLTIRLKYTLILFLIVFSFYLTFLFISQIILKNKAIVGEEADLGVLIFIIAFHFLPCILCLISISY